MSGVDASNVAKALLEWLQCFQTEVEWTFSRKRTFTQTSEQSRIKG